MAKGVTRTVSKQDPQTQQKRRSLEVQMLKSTTKQPTSHNLGVQMWYFWFSQQAGIPRFLALPGLS